ncbi:MAG TPA: hypothetical protein VL332_02175 [Candidatus Saccharimonadaceae bacterium]|jgi:hypothetical protein|nr:hypothetical protein [Candidatus Saccharimonadaceae bacterium]
MRRLFPLLILAVLAASCAKSEPDHSKQLTERQRDSILAKEPIPGASVVGRALQASDRAAADAARADSLP